MSTLLHIAATHLDDLDDTWKVLRSCKVPLLPFSSTQRGSVIAPSNTRPRRLWLVASNERLCSAVGSSPLLQAASALTPLDNTWIVLLPDRFPFAASFCRAEN